MKKRGESSKSVEEKIHDVSLEKTAKLKRKIYKFGFWLFFALALFSVTFSVVAVTSIYRNFQVVTEILDQSFERTNLVLDITSGKIAHCQAALEDCQQQIRGQSAAEPSG